MNNAGKSKDPMDRTRFLIVNPTCLTMLPQHRPWLDSLGVEVVEGRAGKLLGSLEGVDALIGPAAGMILLDADAMRTAGRLKVISLASSGYESVNVLSATRCGIVVTHAPVESLGEVVADLTWGLMLSLARQIPEHHLRLQRGNANRGMAKSPCPPGGAMVWGRTLGIVGLGSVGKRVARRAVGFAMKVIAAETRPDLEFCAKHEITIVDLDRLLRQSDFVSLHLRLNSETEGIIGARELGIMKPSSYLINTARWGLVDENALTEAVLNGRIAGAATDDCPQGAARSLLHLPNVVFTPHIGNRVQENADAVCRQAYHNALDVVRGRMPESQYVLNPEVFQNKRVVPLPARWGTAGTSNDSHHQE
jgi:phosphoglycerate dehydrogenase-like enzyme